MSRFPVADTHSLARAIKRMALGASVRRLTGDAAAYFEGAAIGPDLLVNGSFLDGGTTPFGWGVDGAPATQELTTLPVAEGVGNALHLADAAGATTDGIDQTVSGLKASTLYLVEARVLPTTANVILGVANAVASGIYSDVAIPSSGTAWQTLSGLFLTDATPTAPEISLRPDATNYDFSVSHVTLREVGSTAASATNPHQGTTTRGGNRVVTASSVRDGTFGTQTANVEADTVVSVVVPGPGYALVVRATAGIFLATTTSATVELEEQIDGGGWAIVALRTLDLPADQMTLGVALDWVRGADSTNTLTPGSTYQYRLSATSGGANEWNSAGATEFHRVTAMLIRQGE